MRAGSVHEKTGDAAAEASYGGSLSGRNLRPMMWFAEIFAAHEIGVSLIRQLSWTHILAVIPIEDPHALAPVARSFHVSMTCARIIPVC